MTVEIRIRTCPARAEMAEKLRNELGLPETSVFKDDRENGGNPFYMWKKMAENIPADATHICLLDDDVEVSSGFKTIVEQMVQAHPGCAFSLFTTDLNSSYFDEFLEKTTTPYLTCSKLFGCAVILPVSVLAECFSWIDANYDSETVHDGHAAQEYLESKGIQILTTYPGVVQHNGDQSLYDPGLLIRRTVRFQKEPEADWTSTEIAQTPSLKWFAPTGKKSDNVSFADALSILRGDYR